MSEHWSTNVLASVGVWFVGVDIYRHADELTWLLLWVFAAFWIGFIIGRPKRHD